MAKAKQVSESSFDDGKTVDTFGDKVIGSGDNGLATGAEAHQLEATSEQQLVDAAQGEKLMMRVFEFSYAAQERTVVPSKQYVFNQHSKLIRQMLWKDGLDAVLEAEPRVVFSKRKKLFRIFVLARARYGQMWNDKHRTLQEITQNK